MVRTLTHFVSRAWSFYEEPAINHTKGVFKMMFACLGMAYLVGIAVGLFVWKFPHAYTALSTNELPNFLKGYEIWAGFIIFGLGFAILTPILYVGELVYNRYVTPIVTRYQWNEYSWLKSFIVIPGFAIIHLVIILLAEAAARLLS